MDFGISDRTALVTGGAGRIGSKDCEILAQEGADVYVLDVDEDGVSETVDELNDAGYEGTAYPAVCDLTDRDDVSDTIDEVREQHGGVDILVNNAAMVDARSQLKNYDDDLWDRDTEINLTGTYNISKEVFPDMLEQEWGRVINMSSMAGWYGGFGQASYSATKAALIGLGKTMALEGAQSGVTSNIIAPNVVVEDMADMSREELKEFDEYFYRIADATAMKRLGREADVANMVAYLSSEQANYVTGQVVGVTGGIDLFTF
ncbi:MAG: SDR family NAD(P)-dependent oxidoreductase [Haloarculaceae archaeon]